MFSHGFLSTPALLKGYEAEGHTEYYYYFWRMIHNKLFATSHL